MREISDFLMGSLANKIAKELPGGVGFILIVSPNDKDPIEAESVSLWKWDHAKAVLEVCLAEFEHNRRTVEVRKEVA
jgi:hypothetical protein